MRRVDGPLPAATLRKMNTMRRCFIGVVILSIAWALAGCQAPKPIVRPLPPPVVQPMPITPSRPLPTPKAVAKPERSLNGAVIVLDAGHGGKDPGALARHGGQWDEKQIVLDIALKLRDVLARRGAKVIMTRSSDRFISLDGRAGIAERNHADLFVSIHANAADRSNVSGAEVYIYENASSQSQRAALRMGSAIKARGIYLRGIYRRNFHVLREHSRPAMLIECGYLTNPADARNLNNRSYRATLVTAISEGIASYFGK